MFQKIPDVFMAFEQCFDLFAEFAIVAAGALKKRSPLAPRQLQGFREDFHVAIGRISHRIAFFRAFLALIAAVIHNTRRDLILKRLT
jgi:hypothetical protein